MLSQNASVRFATVYSRPSINTGEKKLLMAILIQAIRDLIYPGLLCPTRDVAFDARNWFFSQETYTGSFLWVCAALEIKPEPFRQLAEGLRSEDRRTQKEMFPPGIV